MKQLLLLCLFFTFLVQSNATRCFECQNIPYPRACSKLAICSSDENCFTEQIVTTSGSIVYNIGCTHKQRCSIIGDRLVGKRTSNITRRSSTDISTCIECCHGDFCNNQGCGTKAVPVEQRGPYCYKCDSLLDPKACSNVAVCLQNELCLLYSPVEFAGLPETIYKGTCGKQSDCNVLSHTASSSRCSPTCCNTDFCNDQCGVFVHNYKPPLPTPTRHTHSHDVTTSTSSAPTKICDTNDGYIHLKNSEADLCVRIGTHNVQWDDAQTKCQKDGGDLVVLDTVSKALLLRRTLAGDPHYAETAYWIGAKDFSNKNQYSWINHTPVNAFMTDWDLGEPNNYKPAHEQRCVCMFRNTHNADRNFQWHDKHCGYRCGFICER
ncbi:C-type lectin domain family 4 member A-like isoform X2 [Mercenaria mercenaria]|uniref:C-type lectin domain family 4 member A-like isoform X2 n=1 Tax=Mercenaria mercenaria TaxID=6596 RepID=UPI00234E9B77|nr:C-type lectin domain family 4 member A-like isoform X2 [Mercenaria mercenaria]